MLFERADCLHERPLKVGADAHDLSRRFHLCRERSFCGDKLVKRKSWHLDNTVVQCRFKTCICLACDGIFDLIERVAECNLCRNLGNRIPCRFGGKRRGTAHTGIHLDHTVLKTRRMKCKLHIASACDI